MDFLTAIKTCFTKYAEFGGRARRPEFWWFALFLFLVGVAIDIVLPGSLYFSETEGLNLITWRTPADTVSNLWALATLLPSLAVTVRRLRDSGRHWANIFWMLFPIVGWIVLIVQCAQPSVPEQRFFGFGGPGYGQPGQQAYGQSGYGAPTGY